MPWLTWTWSLFMFPSFVPHSLCALEVDDGSEGEYKINYVVGLIREMESIFEDVGDNFLSQEFYQELATCFSRSNRLTAKSAFKWEQVQSWFQDKQKELALPDLTRRNKAPESHQKPEVLSFVLI
ncbi:hypothetical protein U1Q18_006555 [Sarracenia purpurea var. burkii]